MSFMQDQLIEDTKTLLLALAKGEAAVYALEIQLGWTRERIRAAVEKKENYSRAPIGS